MLEYVDDNVEIRKSTLNKGQGIFAKETIQKGKFVLVEKAFMH